MRLYLATIPALLLLGVPASSQTVVSSASSVQVVTVSGTCCGGATTETNVAAIRIPGGSMGTTGAVDVKCLWTYPNSASNKTLTHRFSTTSGAISGGGIMAAQLVVTTTASAQTNVVIRNTATNAQIAYGGIPNAPFGATATANTTSALDTTADTFLNINATTASGAETVTLQQCVALIMRAP